MIEIDGLRNTYGDVVAVDDVSFAAEPGWILGLLGPNGAGKSTIIGCISGLLKPTAGRARVLGKGVAVEGRAARAKIGVGPQELALYEDLSAEENLRYWGGAYGLRGRALDLGVRDLLATTGLAAAGGQVFLTLAYHHAPAGQISIWSYSHVLFSLLLGFAFWGEHPALLNRRVRRSAPNPRR